jgi:hypothetical protein
MFGAPKPSKGWFWGRFVGYPNDLGQLHKFRRFMPYVASLNIGAF